MRQKKIKIQIVVQWRSKSSWQAWKNIREESNTQCQSITHHISVVVSSSASISKSRPNKYLRHASYKIYHASLWLDFVITNAGFTYRIVRFHAGGTGKWESRSWSRRKSLYIRRPWKERKRKIESIFISVTEQATNQTLLVFLLKLSSFVVVAKFWTN
jgi:hypothetical protein